MSEVVLSSLITGLCAVIGQWLISRKNRKDEDVKRAVREQIVNDRLDAIEHKLDIHNGYAEKLGDLRRDVAVIAAKMESIS